MNVVLELSVTSTLPAQILGEVLIALVMTVLLGMERIVMVLYLCNVLGSYFPECNCKTVAKSYIATACSSILLHRICMALPIAISSSPLSTKHATRFNIIYLSYLVRNHNNSE